MNKLVENLTNLDLDLKYGALVSGGLDSAVMLTLLVKLNPGIDIQPFSMNKVDESYKFVNPLIDHINYHLGTSIKHTILVGDPNLEHNQHGKFCTEYIINTYPEIAYIYNGVTKNPEELKNYNGAPKRAKSRDHIKVMMPFVHSTKDLVVDLMFEYGVEWLSDITHSCTRMKINRCGVCFQCQERKLAYILNNKIDTGVI